MLKKLVPFMVFLVYSFTLISCGIVSDDEDNGKTHDTGFQLNGSFYVDEEYPDFKLLEIFDGRGSLEEIWDSIDGTETNDRLEVTVDTYTDEFIRFSNVAAGILSDPGEPVENLLGTDLRNIVGILLDTDEHFRATTTGIGEFYTQSGEEYNDGFYSMLDALWEAGNRPGDTQIVDMAGKVVSRIRDKKTPAEIRDDMQELIDDILDEDFTEDFTDVAGLISKLLVQTDYPVWVDEEGNLLNRDEIDPSIHTNIGIGNAVQGVNDFTAWFNTMLVDSESRSYIYTAIREAVTMFDPDPASPNSEKVKTLIRNLEDHFTSGGSLYETNAKYKSVDSDPTYTDTELGQTVREALPHLTQILIRSDRETSLITNDSEGNPVYLLREMVDLLKGVGFNPDDRGLEASLYNMLRYDQWGRDRLDQDSGSYDASHLDSLLFLTVLSTNIGWGNGGTTGEISEDSDPNYDHGHGQFNSLLSLNDSLISMTTHKTLGLGIYDIALNEGDENHLFRSYKPFNITDSDLYKYSVDLEYPVLRSLAGTCAGDIGAPTGGNREGIPPSKNRYEPFNPTGHGESQLAAWTINWATRASIGGEGPYYYADPNAETIMVGGKQYYTYLRPDGRIYALVNKDSDTWEYIYPTDTGDREDPETDFTDYNGKRERFNRYKSTWYSDYYMSHYTEKPILFWEPDVEHYKTVNNSGGNLELVETSGNAGRLTYHELVPEDDAEHSRACSSPEEAMYRNYQWVYTEKKMVLILPQYLDIEMIGIGAGEGSLYMVLEAHGWSGLANMRKFGLNHYWAKKGSDGYSDIPGDYRVEIVADIKGLSEGILNENSIYNETIGTGHATPSLVGRSLPSLYRLGFPLSPAMDRGNGVVDYELGSSEFEVGDEIWNNRNTILAPLLSIWGALMKYTPDHESYGTEEPYNSDALRNGLRGFLNGVAPLIKPQIYFDKENGVGEAAPYSTWKMRVQGEQLGTRVGPWTGHYSLQPAVGFEDDEKEGDEEEGDDFTWNGSAAERLHYQPATLKTLVNMLTDSDITAPIEEGKRMDGVLPIITETKTITNLVKALMSDANDSDQLYSSLEQIAGAVQYTKGTMTDIYGDPNADKPIPFPSWMFATGTDTGDFGEYTSFTDVRDEDIVLDKWLDKLIGHDSTPEIEGYGFANYVDEQEAENWAGFNDDLDTLEDFLHPSSDYSLVESFIEFSDETFAREALYSNEKIAGLLYSLGKLFTYYDSEQGRWVVQGEEGYRDIYNILKLRLPALHDLIKDDTGENYSALLTVNADMLKDGGMIHVLLDHMSTDDGAEAVLNDLYEFLGDDLVTQSKPLWSTLSQLLTDLAGVIEEAKDGSLMDEVYKEYGFQDNGGF